MSSMDSSSQIVALYGTLGRGLEELARAYLASVASGGSECSIVDYSEGKLIFHSSFQSVIDVFRVGRAKFFERLFLLIDRDRLIKEDGSSKNKRELFDRLFSILLDSDGLVTKMDLWKRIRKNLEPNGPPQEEEVSFRLSIKCTGKWRKKIDIPRLCESLGPKIAARTHWRVELRRPALEFSIRISDADLFVGLPLTREPLSNRPYIVHMGLRGSICDAMVQLANLRDGSTILDPMCGAGTILFEAAARSKTVMAVGVDIDQRQLSLAAENSSHFEKTRPKHGVPEEEEPFDSSPASSVCIFPADARYLPFKDNTFDRIISDIPFGQQHSSPEALKTLYPLILGEMLRVIKEEKDSRIVLLTSRESYSLLRDSLDHHRAEQVGSSKFRETSKIDISLGETDGTLVVLEMKEQPQMFSTVVMHTFGECVRG